MLEVIKYITSDFFVFMGCLIIILFFIDTLFRIINRFIRMFNIKNHGWPPKHLDADGDFKTEE